MRHIEPFYSLTVRGNLDNSMAPGTSYPTALLLFWSCSVSFCSVNPTSFVCREGGREWKRHCAVLLLLGVLGSIQRDPELKWLPPVTTLSCRKTFSLVISKHHCILWQRKTVRDAVLHALTHLQDRRCLAMAEIRTVVCPD